MISPSVIAEAAEADGVCEGKVWENLICALGVLKDFIFLEKFVDDDTVTRLSKEKTGWKKKKREKRKA